MEHHASQYGWDITVTCKKTLYQLSELSKKCEARIYVERRITANIIRAAHHADGKEFEKHLESLNPDRHRKKVTEKLKSPSALEGIVVEEL